MVSPERRTCFPLYILPAGAGWQVLISPGRRDMAHPDLWRLIGARVLARRLGIDVRVLVEIPYACHRARVVGSVVYWGGDLDAAQRQEVTAALRAMGLLHLRWIVDQHEVRLDHDRERLAVYAGVTDP